MRLSTAEDAFMAGFMGKGSKHGSTWFGRAGDVIQRPPSWLGIAGIIAATGPSGRRAAARGLVGYGSAALVHLPIKVAVGRRHPRGSALHQLGPFLSSFPSGHSAADLAFALCASQEIPWLMIPLSGGTMAVHWALMRKRAHYPSDVFAGGVLGIAVALTMWKVWPPTRGAGTGPDVLREA